MYTITNDIIKKTGLPEAAVQQTIDALRDIIVEQCAIGQSVSVRGICTVSPVKFKQLQVGGKFQEGFLAKVKLSKTLMQQVEQASLLPENKKRVVEDTDIEQAMSAAGIAVMELPGLS